MIGIFGKNNKISLTSNNKGVSYVIKRNLLMYSIINYATLLLLFFSLLFGYNAAFENTAYKDVDKEISAVYEKLNQYSYPLKDTDSRLPLNGMIVAYYDVYNEKFMEGYGINTDNVAIGEELGDNRSFYNAEIDGRFYRIYTVQLDNRQYVKIAKETGSMGDLFLRVNNKLTAVILAGIFGLGAASVLLAYVQVLPYKRSIEHSYSFSSNVSHELYTPLSIVKANMQTLLRTPNERISEVSDQIATAIGEIDHLQRLTQNLLMLSRSDDKRLILVPSVNNIKNILTDISEPYSFIAEEQDKTFDYEIDDSCDTDIMIDRDACIQMMVALLDNAVKYTESGERIAIGANIADKKLYLWVSDSGRGVEAQDLSKIFMRFYRADSSRTSSGNGLGLSIVHALVENMGGKIVAENLSPIGFKVSITIPLDSNVEKKRFKK